MELSTFPPASTGDLPAPNNMNSPTALPAPTNEAEASLPSRLDLSTALITTTQAAPAVIANAAPPSHSSTPNHPPYAEMITTAIRALHDRKGSSKIAIKKYIDATYSNLPSAHASLLTTHLKRLKNTGIIVMVKHSYKLPNPNKAIASSSSSGGGGVAFLSVPEKKSPGRPPKPKPLGTQPTLPKRSPGRPPKTRPPVVGPERKRPRGRPPKPKPILIPGSNGFVTQPNPKRQSKKPRPIAVTPLYGFLPPKQPRKSPKVRLFVDTDITGKGAVAGIPRSRGRPRKNTVLSSSGDVGASTSASIRQQWL
ncbi:HMG-Y-related protein A-like [Telopea speciosissima]|uniref:HMG-Y-related protein A-like n=1 Tax=Telopea speciosissima TaxID=54955 RepID=UPI001CC43540|nr:HMG-Y-related protein A-like [Telopea speciosissima]